MDHWVDANQKSSDIAYSHLSAGYEVKIEVNDSKQHTLLKMPDVRKGASKNADGLGEESNATTVTPVNESLTVSPMRTRKESSEPFPMFKLSQKNESLAAQKKDRFAYSHESLRSRINLNSVYNKPFGWLASEAEPLSREHHIQSQGPVPSPAQPFEPQSISEMQRNPLPSFMCRQHEMIQSSRNLALWKHIKGTNHYSYSSVLAHENSTSGSLDHIHSRVPVLKENDVALQYHEPSPRRDCELDLIINQRQQLHKESSLPLFSSQSIPLEVGKSKEHYHGSTSQPQSQSFHDVKALRIYTTLDSMDDSSRGFPKFSQRTHHLLVSKKTDINFSDTDKLFRKSTISTKSKENALNELLSFSSAAGYHIHQGMELQTLRQFEESKQKQNIRDVITSLGFENESSAETNTMDINAFLENLHHGIVSSPSSKPAASQAAISLSEKRTKARIIGRMVPDINQEPPELPALASLISDRETNTSRTNSLDAEHLFSHADQPANSKSSSIPESSLAFEASSRWVKRLKLNTSGFAYGTKSSNIGEFSHEKINNIFSKILKRNKAGSEPIKTNCDAGAQRVPDLTSVVLPEERPYSFNPAKRDVSLSYPWIRRWMHAQDATSQKKHDLVVICEPQTSKAVKEKQFASIAAMALMGKAASSLHPCEFVKRGSFVVWNTKGQ